MSPAAMFDRLQAWRAQGLLRALDLAFARFLHELDPQAGAGLLLGAALLARLEGRGHAGLPLQAPAEDWLALLDWPADQLTELAATRRAAGAWDEAAASPLVQVEPADETGGSPLVQAGGRLVLRRHWVCERRIASALAHRVAQALPVAELDLFAPFDLARARGLLERLFPQEPGTPRAGPDWQKVACALALRAPLTLLTGGPGTGKTYTAARMLALMQATRPGDGPLRVALAAPTGKAAARLRQSIELAWQTLRPELLALGLEPGAIEAPVRCGTLHALLGSRPGTRLFRHDAEHPLELDLLFVDEASMVHLEMMAALLEALPTHARLVLMGDKDQLASVEAGSVMADLCQGTVEGDGAQASGLGPQAVAWVRQLCGQALPAASTGRTALSDQVVVLRESRRFAGAIGALARAVNAGEAATALQLLREPSGAELALRLGEPGEAAVPLAVRGREAPAAGFLPFVQALATRPDDPQAFEGWARELLQRFEACRVLCALREGPWGVVELNAAIERALVPHGLPARRGEWYEGRPVMVTRNDPALGVFNGDIGLVLRAPGPPDEPGAPGGLRAWFAEGPRLHSVAVGRLAEVETAFAMTVHKSQGSEFAHVVLVLPEHDSPVLTRELLYTGITRARLALTLVCRDAALVAAAAQRRTRRFSGLGAMLAQAPA